MKGQTRRTTLATMAASTLVGLMASSTKVMAVEDRRERRLDGQSSWTPPPALAPAREGMLDVGGARLWYWDTGGSGMPIVLLHAATGSGAVWGYQQSAFAAAGLRVIGYSRRGHFRSEFQPNAPVATSTSDLHRLVEHLGVERFVLLGSALGGYTVTDYAISHPERLHGIILASTMAGIREPDYLRQTALLTPAPWSQMPESFRELGPSYRAAYPEGVVLWEALERESRTRPSIRQGLENRISWKMLEEIRVRTLFITGDADLYMPPSRARQVVRHMKNAQLLIVPDAGHSAYWEQPLAFNRAVLEFIE